MPRYYFHLAGNRPVQDDDGVDLTDNHAALRHGNALARELLEKHSAPPRFVLVVAQKTVPRRDGEPC